MEVSVYNPEWATSDAVALAKSILSDRDSWSKTPILADALQDAGCDDERLLHILRHEVGNVAAMDVLCWLADYEYKLTPDGKDGYFIKWWPKSRTDLDPVASRSTSSVRNGVV